MRHYTPWYHCTQQQWMRHYTPWYHCTQSIKDCVVTPLKIMESADYWLPQHLALARIYSLSQLFASHGNICWMAWLPWQPRWMARLPWQQSRMAQLPWQQSWMAQLPWQQRRELAQCNMPAVLSLKTENQNKVSSCQFEYNNQVRLMCFWLHK